MAKCDDIRELINEAEDAKEEATAFEIEQTVRALIAHPKDATLGYLNAKNKKLVELAQQSHVRLWNRLTDHLWKIAQETNHKWSPIVKGLAWSNWLITQYPTTSDLVEVTVANPRRLLSLEKRFNKMLDKAEAMELADLSGMPEDLKYRWRLEKALLPPTMSSWSKDRLGVIAKFIGAATELTEASRTLAFKSSRKVAEANGAFRRKLKDIISDNPITDEFVMDGYRVKTQITGEEDFKEVHFLGSYKDENGELKHKAETDSGLVVELNGVDIRRQEIEDGLVSKYMNEFVNELSSGDARYVEWSDISQATKSDLVEIHDVLDRAEMKSTIKEGSGEMHEIDRRNYSYTYVMVKQAVGEQLEGHGQKEVYKAFIVNHTDLRTDKKVYYLDEKDSKQLHNGIDIFSEQNGYYKARVWKGFGEILAMSNGEPKKIDYSVDKQPVLFSRMPSQPNPMIVGDVPVPAMGLGGPTTRMTMWQLIGSHRGTLKHFGEELIVLTRQNNERIVGGAKKMPALAKQLGWTDELVPEGESAELYYMSKILNLWNGTQSIHVNKQGDLHTRNSFFNMKKMNYYPWSWWDDVTIDMAGKAIDDISSRKAQVLNPTPSQEEAWEEQTESLMSIIHGQNPNYDYNDEARSRINVGARTAMTKHRVLWTDPTLRRKDGGVLKNYIDTASYSVTSESLTALAMETIIELGELAIGTQKLLQNEVDFIINRLKLALNDPTSSAGFPLPGGKTLAYDNSVVAGFLNGMSKELKWGVQFDEASSQRYILMMRGMVSANLLRAPSALVNRTQSMNDFVVVGWDYFTRANKIQANNYIDDNGVDWLAIIDYMGTDQLVTALVDITTPAEEVDMRDMGFYPIPAPVISWIPATAAKSLYRMKVWGKDGFIQRGIPEIDKYLQQMEEQRLWSYRKKKKFLKEKGMDSKDAKRLAKLLHSIEFEWKTEQNYDKRRNIKELRKVLIELIRLDEGETVEDRLRDEVLKAKLNNLFGHISDDRLKKIVSWTLNWLPIGPKGWFTFSGGEQIMRRHAIISHLMMAGDSGMLGKWSKEVVTVTYINDKGVEVTVDIPMMYTSPKALQIGRRGVRNEFFGMTKVHMGEALSGLGEFIHIYKGYPIQQQMFDNRIAGSFMDGSLLFGEGLTRLQNEYRNVIIEHKTGKKYDPMDPELDAEARAMLRLLFTRLATTFLIIGMELLPFLQRLLLKSGTGQTIRNIIRGAENPLFSILMRGVLRGIVYGMMDDEDKLMSGGREMAFQIARLLFPLFVTLPLFQIYYGAQDGKRLWERY